MRKLMIAALFAAGPAFAGDLVARNGDDSVRLSEKPCTFAGVLMHLRPEWRDKFQRARARIGGQDYFACWIKTPSGDYYVLYEDGDKATIPAEEFKEDPGV